MPADRERRTSALSDRTNLIGIVLVLVVLGALAAAWAYDRQGREDDGFSTCPVGDVPPEGEPDPGYINVTFEAAEVELSSHEHVMITVTARARSDAPVGNWTVDLEGVGEEGAVPRLHLIRPSHELYPGRSAGYLLEITNDGERKGRIRFRVDREADPNASVPAGRARLVARVVASGDEATVHEMDRIYIDFIGCMADGSLYATNVIPVAEDISVRKYPGYFKSEKGPFPLLVGDGTLIEGVEEAVIGLRAGETTAVRIPPNKAYGYKEDYEGEAWREYEELLGKVLLYEITVVRFAER